MNGVIAPRPYPGTYFTFDDITKMPGTEVKDVLQLPREPTHFAEFDTLQIIDNINIPLEYHGQGLFHEPITVSYSEFGMGKKTQGVTTKPIIINNVGEFPK